MVAGHNLFKAMQGATLKKNHGYLSLWMSSSHVSPRFLCTANPPIRSFMTNDLVLEKDREQSQVLRAGSDKDTQECMRPAETYVIHRS
jgi:hypothetical protein